MMFVFKERRWKLKKGTVQDQDIRKISYSAAVKEKRKRICRALLGVENADSHLADIAQNQDIEEQTYQIFRKWKQSKPRTFVTYQALAQALLDRTVNLDQVVTDFCTAIQGGEENWRLLSGNCSSLFRCSFLVWHCCLFVMAVKFDLSPLLSAFSNLQYRQLSHIVHLSKTDTWGAFHLGKISFSTGLNANDTRSSTGNFPEQTDTFWRIPLFPFQADGTEIPVPFAQFCVGRRLATGISNFCRWELFKDSRGFFSFHFLSYRSKWHLHVRC